MIIYLYHKRHKITGLNYFGKTTRDPLNYKGSGIYWLAHLKKHGRFVDTIEIWKFDDQCKCSEFAIRFSENNNIVESTEWANLCIEDGLMGGNKLSDMTDEQREKRNSKVSISQTETWRKRDRAKHQQAMRDRWMNADSDEKITIHRKISETLLNKTAEQRRLTLEKRNTTYANKTAEQKQETLEKLRKTLAKRPLRICPHCGLEGTSANMDRYHFDNCKLSTRNHSVG